VGVQVFTRPHPLLRASPLIPRSLRLVDDELDNEGWVLVYTPSLGDDGMASLHSYFSDFEKHNNEQVDAETRLDTEWMSKG
jgi:hypothetical protein